MLIAEVDVTGRVDFMDGYHHQVLIEYTPQEDLTVTILDSAKAVVRNNNVEPILSVPIKLTEFITLDNGTAYLGFCQETANLANVLLIENWVFESSIKANQKDPWSGLSLVYKCNWPIHLMFSPDIHEKYNTLYRFLLPIKRVQLEL